MVSGHSAYYMYRCAVMCVMCFLMNRGEPGRRNASGMVFAHEMEVPNA